jgi:hypothetical protein
MCYDDRAMPNRRYAPGWLLRLPAIATMPNWCLSEDISALLSAERSRL